MPQLAYENPSPEGSKKTSINGGGDCVSNDVKEGRLVLRASKWHEQLIAVLLGFCCGILAFRAP